MLRDQALSLSGLLTPLIGGPAVKPYQPDGIWEEASFGKIKYTPDTGEKLYRRTLYTFWRRIVGPTMIFDNAPRQFCAVKSHAHQHAVASLGHDERTHLHRIRTMAQRALQNKTASDTTRIQELWQNTTSRQPLENEAKRPFRPSPNCGFNLPIMRPKPAPCLVLAILRATSRSTPASTPPGPAFAS